MTMTIPNIGNRIVKC